MKICLFLILFFITQAFAGLPVDIVFDLDQTIGTLVHEGPYGDLLADPLNPKKGIVSITFENAHLDSLGKQTTKLITEEYRIYDGVSELLTELKRHQLEGRVRVSFFSAGSAERNQALLKKLVLSDGTTASQLAGPRIYDRTHLFETKASEDARYRERFKKDLTVVNKNLEDVIIIDDIKTYVPAHQEKHLLWIGEDFPYPEKLGNRPPFKPSELILQRERNKYKWITNHIMNALDKRFKEGIPMYMTLAETTKNGTITPFSSNQESAFKTGKLKMQKFGGNCDYRALFKAYLNSSLVN